MTETLHFAPDATTTLCGAAVLGTLTENDSWTEDAAIFTDHLPRAEVCAECSKAAGFALVYVMPEENLSTFREKLEKLNRRAPKLGVDPVTIESVRFDHRETWTEDKREFARTWVAVRLLGTVVRYAGYTFLATLHHTTEGNIVAAVPGRDVPREYRNAPSACDHCRTARRRTATYLVRKDETGAVVQVGNSCLADFLGGDPHRMAAWAEYLGAFASWASESCEDRAPRTEWSFTLESFLDAVVRVVRVDGWVSKKLASETDRTATATTVWSFLTIPTSSKTYREMTVRYAPLPNDAETVKLVTDWAESTLRRTDLNDYEHNLFVVVRSRLVNYRVSGLAASLLQAYRRATQVAEERKGVEAGPVSEFVGKEKERLRSVPVTVVAVISMPPTDFGPRTLLKFRDDAGNLMVWFTGTEGSVKSGDRMLLTGTVKRHSSFAGAKQTELSRCALASGV